MQLKMKSRAKILCMTLAMLLQRLPTLPLGKHLSTFFAPIAAHVKTLRALLPATAATTLPHALTGATTYVRALDKIDKNPATGTEGDAYTFRFYTHGHEAQSYLISGLPNGLTFNGDKNSPTISGTLPSVGKYEIQIKGYRWANRQGPSTSTYKLVLQVEEASPWSGDSTETLDAGFKSSRWFGNFYDNGDGWAYHPKHGWLFVTGSGESSLWMWDGQLGWLYTGNLIYPFFYRDSTSDWLYYKERENARQFWDFAKGTWTTYEKN
jgi:hypothetical protein